MGETTGNPKAIADRRWLTAALIASAGPWALWVWQDGSTLRMAARWWATSGEWTVLVSAVLWSMAPFGHNIRLDYGPAEQVSGQGLLEFVVLPMISSMVFGWLTRDWTSRGLRRAGWFAAAWVSVSMFLGFGTFGILAPFFHPEWSFPQALGWAFFRLAVALPFLLGYVVWFCPVLVAWCHGAFMRIANR